MKKTTLNRVGAIILTAILCFSISGCNKSENWIEAEKAVEAIGEVTLESSESIQKAEEAYGKLTEEEKAKFKLAETITQAKEEYNRIVLEDSAKKVEEQINTMGEASIDNLEKITEAQKAYDALTDDAKALVKNYDTLKTAQEKIAVEKKAKAEELLSTMRMDEDKVQQAKFYWPNGWEFYDGSWVADERSFALPYIVLEKNGVYYLRFLCNYTGDDWVFFKKITFSVDGTNYYENFNYHDVVRDNAWGTVWEYVDMGFTEKRLELLKAISNSNETIVRFEGDEHYSDFIVTAQDKQTMKDAVAAYELLR